MPKASSRNVKVQSHPVSSSVSNEQSFNDRLALIVRQLNSKYGINPYIITVFPMHQMENTFFIYTNGNVIPASDLAEIQSEFGAIDILLNANHVSICGEITE